MCILLLAVLATAAAAATTKPIYTLTPNSHIQDIPSVIIRPLSVDSHNKFNIFHYGEDISIQLSALSIDLDIPKGSIVQAWFSSLSAGNVARLAANQFMPNTDLCSELKNLDPLVRKEFELPKNCPIKAGRKFQVDKVLDQSFWKGVEEYKSYVVGAKGVLELRLWDNKPCVVCWKKPNLLVGVSLPFEIRGKSTSKKQQKKKKKKMQKDRKKHSKKQKRGEL